MMVESTVVATTQDDDVESIGSSQADQSGEWVDGDHDDESEEEWEDNGSSEEFEVVNGADSHEELKAHLEDDHGRLDHTSAASPTQSVTSNSSTSSSKNNNSDTDNNNDTVAALNDATTPTASTTIVAASTLKTKRKNPMDGSFHEKEFLCTISSSNPDATTTTTSDSTTTTSTSDARLQVNIVDKEHNKSVLTSSITDIFKDAGDLLVDLNTFLTELDSNKNTTETIPEEETTTTTEEDDDVPAPPTTELKRTPSQILVNQSGVQIQRGNSSRQLLLSANSKRLSDSVGQNDNSVSTSAATTDAIIRGSNKEQQAAAVMTILANPKVLKSLNVLDERTATPSQNEEDTDFWLEVEQLESVEGDLAEELNRVSILDVEKSILEDDVPDDDPPVEIIAEKEESPTIDKSEESSSPSSATAMNEQENSNTTDALLPTEEPNEVTTIESKNSKAVALDKEEPNSDDKDKTTEVQDNDDVDTKRKSQTKHKEMMSAMMEALNDDDDLKLLDDDLKLLDDDLDGMTKDDADVAPVVIIPRAAEEEAPPEDEEEWEDDEEHDAEWDEDEDDEDAEWEDGEEGEAIQYKPVAMPVQYSPQSKDEEVKQEEEEEEEWEEEQEEDLEKGMVQPLRLEEADVENPAPANTRSLEVEEASTKGKQKTSLWSRERYNRYRGCGLIVLGILLIGIGVLTQL